MKTFAALATTIILSVTLAFSAADMPRVSNYAYRPAQTYSPVVIDSLLALYMLKNNGRGTGLTDLDSLKVRGKTHLLGATDGTTLDLSGTLTGAAADFTGAVTVTGNLTAIMTAGYVNVRPTTATAQAAFHASSNSGARNAYFGVDNSAGNNFDTGIPYSTVIWSGGDIPISFVTNSTLRLVVGGDGTITAASLAGVGTRALCASSTGVVAACL